jgi:hypothetical protein
VWGVVFFSLKVLHFFPSSKEIISSILHMWWIQGVVVVVSIILKVLCAPLCPCNTSANFRILNDVFVATNGTSWMSSYGWTMPSIPVCLWYGVTCTNASITSIELSANGLSGTASLSCLLFFREELSALAMLLACFDGAVEPFAPHVGVLLCRSIGAAPRRE